MTKIEIAIQTVDLKIEAAQKDIEKHIDSIKSYTSNTNMGRIHYDAAMIEDEAKRLAKAAQELQMLTEQKQTLEYLANQ